VVGHKSNECQNSGMTYNVNDETSEDIGHVDIDVGGVWMIGAVHVENPPGLSVKTSNRFEVLADNEDEWEDMKKRKGVRGWKCGAKCGGKHEEIDIGAVERIECFKGGLRG
jgi:hypothetical protein